MSTTNSTDSLKLCQILDSQKTVSVNSTNLECDDSINAQVFTSNLILGGFYVVGYVVIALVIKYGRGFVFGIYSNEIEKFVLIPWIILTGFCLTTSGISGLVMLYTTNSNFIIILFGLQIMMSGVCVSVNVGTVVDLIPTHLK